MPSQRAIATILLLGYTAVQSFAPVSINRFRERHHMACQASQSSNEDNFSLPKLATTALVAFSLIAAPSVALADGQTKTFKLPPIDFNDQSRCSLKSSSIGQANAARDKLYDLRLCKLSGANAVGFDLSGVIMTDTDLSKANLKDAYFSKGYLHDSNFDGADFSNGIIDRASFKGSSLKGAIFTNSVLTGTSFENANLEGADFSDAYLGDFDIRAICKNPTLKGENPVTGMDSRFSVGCK